MKVTYYVEILSSWCMWAEPMWADLKARYAPLGVQFEWKIALMRPCDFPKSREQCDWFYRRSGGTVLRSPFMLNSGWFEPFREGLYVAPNLVAEAGKDFGFTGDELRLALATGALREGRKIGSMEEAIALGVAATKIDAARLRTAAESVAVRNRVEASTAEFFEHKIDQRPAFVVRDAIGDKAVFSGLVRLEPLAATIETMLSDTSAYAAHREHYGEAPTV